jgi:hypothetical protein
MFLFAGCLLKLLTTFAVINSGSLRGCPLSTDTNAGAAYELSIKYFARHFL